MAHKNYKLKHRALANQVLVNILLEPEKHNQRSWGMFDLQEDVPLEQCATTACVAGHAALMTGNASFNLDENHIGYIVDLKLNEQATEKFGVDENDFFWLGKKLFGLNKNDAALLFYATNNDQAVQALAYIAADKKIDWFKIAEFDEEKVETAFERFYEDEW